MTSSPSPPYRSPLNLTILPSTRRHHRQRLPLCSQTVTPLTTSLFWLIHRTISASAPHPRMSLPRLQPWACLSCKWRNTSRSLARLTLRSPRTDTTVWSEPCIPQRLPVRPRATLCPSPKRGGWEAARPRSGLVRLPPLPRPLNKSKLDSRVYPSRNRPSSTSSRNTDKDSKRVWKRNLLSPSILLGERLARILTLRAVGQHTPARARVHMRPSIRTVCLPPLQLLA